MLSKSYIFSFKEVLEVFNTSIKAWATKSAFSTIFTNYETYLGYEIRALPFTDVDGTGTLLIDTSILDVFDLLIARFLNHGFLKLDHEEIGADDKDKVIEVFNNLLTQLANTFPRYNELCTYYNDSVGELMKKIESTSTSSTESSNLQKHSDTPQNEGDWLADTHTTDINKTNYDNDTTIENSTEKDSPIVRINEIQTQYRNVLLEWTNELEKCFYEEV